MMRRAMGLVLGVALGVGAATATLAQTMNAGPYLAGVHALHRNDPVAAAEYFADVARRDPGNGFVVEQAMLNQVLAGDVAAAARTAERLARLVPEHRLANLLLTARDFRRNGYDAALTRLSAPGAGFHPLIGGLMTVWAAAGAGDDAAVEAALVALGDTGLEGVLQGYHRALLALWRDQPEAALAAVSKVRTELGARSGGIALAEGMALEQLGRPDEAAALYAEMAGDPSVDRAAARLAAGEMQPPLITAPEDGAAEALYTVAGLLMREEESRSAIAHARLAAYLRPDLEAATLLIAGQFAAGEQYALAAETLAVIPADSPNALRADIARAEALEALDRGEEAIALMRSLRDSHPDDHEPAIMLGDLLRRSEQWELCADAYSTAVDMLREADRLGWALLYQRAICYERAGLWDLAETDFKAALAMEPEQPFVLNYLGYSWVEMGRHLDEARDMIERAVAQRPDNGYITDSLGWVLYRLGDFDGAVDWLEKAVELAPVDPVINDHLGDALWMVGRKLEARFQWKRARSFDPEEKDLTRIRRKLAVGLDTVLAEEQAAAAAESPAAAQADTPGQTETRPDGG